MWPGTTLADGVGQERGGEGQTGRVLLTLGTASQDEGVSQRRISGAPRAQEDPGEGDEVCSQKEAAI